MLSTNRVCLPAWRGERSKRQHFGPLRLAAEHAHDFAVLLAQPLPPAGAASQKDEAERPAGVFALFQKEPRDLCQLGLPRLGMVEHNRHALVLRIPDALLQRLPCLLGARLIVAIIAVEKARGPAALAQGRRHFDQEARLADTARPVIEAAGDWLPGIEAPGQAFRLGAGRILERYSRVFRLQQFRGQDFGPVAVQLLLLLVEERGAVIVKIKLVIGDFGWERLAGHHRGDACQDAPNVAQGLYVIDVVWLWNISVSDAVRDDVDEAPLIMGVVRHRLDPAGSSRVLVPDHDDGAGGLGFRADLVLEAAPAFKRLVPPDRASAVLPFDGPRQPPRQLALLRRIADENLVHV